MLFEDLKNALADAIMDLKPAPIPDEHVEFEMVTLDRTETDNSKWLSYITTALDDAKTFEIHCWNEETEWIELALQYGSLKDDDWRYGKIITGDVTPEFVQMLLGLPKPTDVEIENKMTPFFNVFLDDKFQSCHYGTELYLYNGKGGRHEKTDMETPFRCATMSGLSQRHYRSGHQWLCEKQYIRPDYHARGSRRADRHRLHSCTGLLCP